MLKTPIITWPWSLGWTVGRQQESPEIQQITLKLSHDDDVDDDNFDDGVFDEDNDDDDGDDDDYGGDFVDERDDGDFVGTWSGTLTLPGISPSVKSSSGLRTSTKTTWQIMIPLYIIMIILACEHPPTQDKDHDSIIILISSLSWFNHDHDSIVYYHDDFGDNDNASLRTSTNTTLQDYHADLNDGDKLSLTIHRPIPPCGVINILTITMIIWNAFLKR